MQPGSRKSRTLWWHLLVWAGFVVYEQSVVLFTNTARPDLRSLLLNYLLNAGLFYTSSDLLLPRLYPRPKWQVSYYGSVLLLLAAYAVLRCELFLHVLPTLKWLSGEPPFSYQRFWILSLYRGSFFIFVSAGYWFARNTIRLEARKLEYEQQMRAAERSLLEANLAYLKNQINPHLLFNALNFIYAQIYPHSENAAKGILLLSDIMRYALHEDTNGKVMLTHEVQHLRNYIALHQLRFNNQLRIDFEVVGNHQFLMILPLVLINFVENCFKHGELTDAANPLFIRLTVVQNQLTFHTRNLKRLGPKEKSTGIGLQNTQKRLSLAYDKQYTLEVVNDPYYYTCNLTITL